MDLHHDDHDEAPAMGSPQDLTDDGTFLDEWRAPLRRALITAGTCLVFVLLFLSLSMWLYGGRVLLVELPAVVLAAYGYGAQRIAAAQLSLVWQMRTQWSRGEIEMEMQNGWATCTLGTCPRVSDAVRGTW